MSERGKLRKPRLLPSNAPKHGGTLNSPFPSPAMARRPLLALAAALSLIALYSFSYSALLSPVSRPFSHSAAPPSSPASKIYVYDLPSKFTHGVVRSYHLARAAAGDSKYPGHQHSAEWHLLADLDRPGRPPYSPVARVADPDDADLFYVPFFSSLSLVVNPIRPPVAAGAEAEEAAPAYSDEGMQEELMAWLEKQPYWRRNGGRDHVFICQDPNALYKVVDRIKNAVLLVSDFGRLRPDQGSLVKDVILPYSHRINSYEGELGIASRPSLLFFMGNRYRKEGGKIRDTLFKILENEKDVIIKHGTQSRESRRMAKQGMHSSKFCLHPAGDTPSACRLFDAIVSICIPVIVSDYIELPFEDVIDYGTIAIFVDTRSAIQPGYLTSMLRRIGTKRILQYQRDLKAVKRYFEYEDSNGTVNEIWRQVSMKVPLIKMMINRDKRLVERELDGLDRACICSGNNGTVSFH